MNYMFYLVLACYAVFVILVGWSACRTTNAGWRSGLLLTLMMATMPLWVVAMMWIYFFLTGQGSGFGGTR